MTRHAASKTATMLRFLPFAALACGQAFAAGPEIGAFDRAGFEQGCGCSFQAADDRRADAPLLLRVGADGRATLRLDDELVGMSKTQERVVRKTRKSMTAGDKLLITLVGAGASASVNATLERSCRISEGCRRLDWRGVLTVSGEGGRSALPTWGTCGCSPPP